MERPKSRRILEWFTSHGLWELLKWLISSAIVGIGLKFMLRLIYDPAISTVLILVGVYFLVPVLVKRIQTARAQTPRAEEIWRLKQRLWEIVRRFPDSAFVKRPPDRLKWSPRIGRPETGISGAELEQALEWHDEFERLFPSSSRGPDYQSMSWNETLKFLDYEERKSRGFPI